MRVIFQIPITGGNPIHDEVAEFVAAPLEDQAALEALGVLYRYVCLDEDFLTGGFFDSQSLRKFASIGRDFREIFKLSAEGAN